MSSDTNDHWINYFNAEPAAVFSISDPVPDGQDDGVDVIHSLLCIGDFQ